MAKFPIFYTDNTPFSSSLLSINSPSIRFPLASHSFKTLPCASTSPFSQIHLLMASTLFYVYPEPHLHLHSRPHTCSSRFSRSHTVCYCRSCACRRPKGE
uniref:Ovule protein n=1 Tax=Caenorhabditis tropicalis TaxID=1561998 RepID=A0A1I7ULS5_9PELO